MRSLDDSLVNRAAPPGSMRYFSLLYAPRGTARRRCWRCTSSTRRSASRRRARITTSRTRACSGGAPRSIGWSTAAPQHPATRLLSEQHVGDRSSFAKLHELLAAADMDLARMTYANCARAARVLLAQRRRAAGADRSAAGRPGAARRRCPRIRATARRRRPPDRDTARPAPGRLRRPLVSAARRSDAHGRARRLCARGSQRRARRARCSRFARRRSARTSTHGARGARDAASAPAASCSRRCTVGCSTASPRATTMSPPSASSSGPSKNRGSPGAQRAGLADRLERGQLATWPDSHALSPAASQPVRPCCRSLLHDRPTHLPAAPPTLLRDRVILITGASDGIGKAVAQAAAAHGARVILHGRNVRKLEAVYDAIVAARHPRPSILPLDFEKAGPEEYDKLARRWTRSSAGSTGCCTTPACSASARRSSITTSRSGCARCTSTSTRRSS